MDDPHSLTNDLSSICKLVRKVLIRKAERRWHGGCCWNLAIAEMRAA